jgi:hypothetical protein
MNRVEIEKWVKFEELDASTLLEEKFDKAIIGNDSHDNIIYDIDKMIDILIDEGKTSLEAIDYLDENYFSKDLKTVFMNFYNKELIDFSNSLREKFMKN